jgi:transposase
MKSQKKKKSNPNLRGPKTKTTIKLKKKTKDELINVFKKTTDPNFKERIQAVLMRNEGKKMFEICQTVHKNEKTVIDWLKKYKDKGIKEIKSNYAGGNRRKLTTEQLKEIERFLNKTSKIDIKKLTSKELRLHLKTKYNVEYRGAGSINQIFYKCGFSFRKPEQHYREASEKEKQEWLKETKKN